MPISKARALKRASKTPPMKARGINQAAIPMRAEGLTAPKFLSRCQRARESVSYSGGLVMSKALLDVLIVAAFAGILVLLAVRLSDFICELLRVDALFVVASLVLLAIMVVSASASWWFWPDPGGGHLNIPASAGRWT